MILYGQIAVNNVLEYTVLYRNFTTPVFSCLLAVVEILARFWMLEAVGGS